MSVLTKVVVGTNFPIFGVSAGVAVHRSAAKCSCVICTLKSDLFNFVREDVYSQLYVDSKIDNISFPRSLKLLYLE